MSAAAGDANGVRGAALPRSLIGGRVCEGSLAGEIVTFQGGGQAGKALLRLDSGGMIPAVARCEGGVWRFYPAEDKA